MSPQQTQEPDSLLAFAVPSVQEALSSFLLTCPPHPHPHPRGHRLHNRFCVWGLNKELVAQPHWEAGFPSEPLV